MIRPAPLLTAALMLAACTTSAQPANPAMRITYEAMSWGYVQERWTISADGAATLESPSPGAQLGAPTRTRTIALTPADFARIRDALAPAEAMLKGGVPCDRQIADLPYGAVRWLRADGTEPSLHYDVGCRHNTRLDLLFERMEAASAIFHEAAAAH